MYCFRWADKLQAKGDDGKLRYFDHPFVQSLSMFLGEFLCLLFFKLAYLYYVKKQVGYFVDYKSTNLV